MAYQPQQTTIIQQQQPQQPQVEVIYQSTPQMGTTTVIAAPPQEWRYGLFDCFADAGLSLKTYCCSCITYGETKAKLHNDGSCFTNALIYFCVGVCLVPCIMGGLGRAEIRNVRNIDGSNIGDFVTHWCCGCCALVQEHREVFS